MKQVGIFFGSRSPEHDISIITAMRVLEGFQALRQYKAIPVYIGKNGNWYCGEALKEIAFFKDSRLGAKLASYAIASVEFQRPALILHPRARGILKRAKPIRVDIAFPCFHGSCGEDGTIQGFFEIAGIPYVGCGVLASAITMSKIHTKLAMRQAGIPVVPEIEVSKENFERDSSSIVQKIAQSFSFPLFVKPNALGSSIAVARVRDENELKRAVEIALEFDTLALVEPAIPSAKEVNVAVIGHRELIVSETEEPRFRSAFQTFEEKYITKGGTIRQDKGKIKSRIPAELPSDVSAALKRAAVQAFRRLNASGISRFDFLVNAQTNEWFLGEVNPLPGSLQSHLWEASGVPLPDLIEKLLGYAVERQNDEGKLLRAFTSSVLQE